MAQDTRIGEVYVVRCLANDKEYVGQTIRGYLNRFKDHLAAARKGRDSPFYRAIRKYGPSQFSVEVVWQGPRSELNAAETRFIKERNSFLDTGNGYNLTTGGDQCDVSAEVCARLSEASKRLWSDPSYRDKQTYTAERALKISTFARGRASRGPYQTPEVCKKISEKLLELWNDQGVHERWAKAIRAGRMKEESRERAREANRKRTNTKEFREASSAWQKAAWSDPEYRKTMSAKLRSVKAELCENPDFRKKVVSDLRRGHTQEVIKRRNEAIKMRWKDQEYRERMSAIRKSVWALRKQKQEEAKSGTTIKM